MQIAQITEAYGLVDLSPCQDKFYIETGDEKLCCPLTAMALAEKAVAVDDPHLDEVVYKWAVGKFGLNKVLGFLDGWDWRWPGKDAPQDDPAYREGFEIGKAALKFLVFGR